MMMYVPSDKPALTSSSHLPHLTIVISVIFFGLHCNNCKKELLGEFVVCILVFDRS